MEKEGKKAEIRKEKKKGWFSVIPLFLIISLATILMLSYALYTERSSGKETLKQASDQTAENTKPAGNTQNTVLSPGCKDTDGDDMDELGVVYLAKDNKRIKYVDKCLDKHTVKEYFCSGADAKAKIYKCASICTICREDASADPAEEKSGIEYAEYTEEQKTKDNESIEQTEEENQQDLEIVKDNTQYYYNCKNGFKDTFETDVDCGGSDCSGCGYNKRCELNQDCTTGLKCNQRLKRCMQ